MAETPEVSAATCTLTYCYFTEDGICTAHPSGCPNDHEGYPCGLAGCPWDEVPDAE